MIVCHVSVFELTLKEGSSSASLLRAIPIFSWSALVFGSTEIDITGSGNSILSRITGFSISHRVSQVFVSLRPITAQILPAGISSISSLWLACICRRRPILCFSQVTELSTYEPDFRVQEYTRTKVILPTNGSVAILKARAPSGSFGSCLKVIFCSSSSTSTQVIVPSLISRGDGR